MIDSGNALLMLRKWSADKTNLLFTFKSIDAGFAIGGKIASASADDCVVKSAMGDATLRFRIDDLDCKFEIADRRSLAESREMPEERGDLVTLLIFFPARFSLEAFRLEKDEPRPLLTIMALHDSEIMKSD